jgi:hypothetical protein
VRRITRNTILAILAVVVLLLALGAVPSLLRSGDPYYVTASVIESPEEEPLVNVSNLSERRYPYITGAVASAESGGDGRSEAYYDGPFGFKEGFAHSPNDEFDAIGQRYGNVTADSTVLVEKNGTAYRIDIVRVPEGETR